MHRATGFVRWLGRTVAVAVAVLAKAVAGQANGYSAAPEPPSEAPADYRP